MNEVPESVKNFYSSRTQDLGDYERSHEPRLDYLIKDLNLDKLANSKIGDFGCGSGRLLYKLPRNQGNTYYGFDGANWIIEEYQKHYFHYNVNLCSEFYDEIWKQEDIKLDVAMCFEVLEHLTDVYTCVFQIKRFLKLDGVFYVSLPAEDSKHPMVYPSLFWPKENFAQFMEQMAFKLIRYNRHEAAFSQNVFVYRNLDWVYGKMLFPKKEPKFFGQPPHIQVNL